MFPFIGLIVLIVALCLIAAYVPMPRILSIILYVAAGIVAVIIVLSLAGADSGYIRIWRP